MAGKFYKGIHFFFLSGIILLLLLDLFTDLVIYGRSLSQTAGILSIFLGTFFFVSDLMLTRKPHILRFLFEILLVFLGSYFYLDVIHELFLRWFQGFDWMIIVVYVLLFGVFLFATRKKSDDVSLDRLYNNAQTKIGRRSHKRH